MQNIEYIRHLYRQHLTHLHSRGAYKDRRRILVWRVPESHPDYDPKNVKILKIPFLLFADETVEDSDAVLLPIIHQLMSEKAKQLGMNL